MLRRTISGNGIESINQYYILYASELFSSHSHTRGNKTILVALQTVSATRFYGPTTSREKSH